MDQIKKILINHEDKLFYFYYIVVFACYCLNVFFASVRPGVIAAMLILIISITAIPNKLRFIDFIILMYLGYNFISIFYNFRNNMPISVGILEFSSSALPVMFYFAANKFVYSREMFYKYFLYACFFCYSIGLLWYITLPDYYIAYFVRLSPRFSINDYIEDRRFFSFLGSIDIGLLAPISAVISYYYLQKTNKKGYLFMFFYSIVISFLSHQRASYIMIIVAAIMVQTRFFKSSITRKIFGMELVGVIGAIVLLFSGSFDAFNKILSVFMRFGSAISSRSGQWITVSGIGDKIILGNGLGSMSHRAVEYADILICDGAYFKLLGELGYVGFFLFFIILLIALYRLFINNYSKTYMMEATIILMFLIQSLGSNSLFFQDTAPLFWVALGFIFSERKYEDKFD